MTREEAKRIAQGLITDFKCESQTMVEFCNVIIEALDQESILDTIRAEIESQRKEISHKYTKDDELQAYYDGLNDGLKDARDILDEYMAESEVSE